MARPGRWDMLAMLVGSMRTRMYDGSKQETILRVLYATNARALSRAIGVECWTDAGNRECIPEWCVLEETEVIKPRQKIVISTNTARMFAEERGAFLQPSFLAGEQCGRERLTASVLESRSRLRRAALNADKGTRLAHLSKQVSAATGDISKLGHDATSRPTSHERGTETGQRGGY